MGERLQVNPIRFTTPLAATQTRINMGAAGVLSGSVSNRPSASSENQGTFWISDDGTMSFSNGVSWVSVSSSGGGTVVSSPTPYARIHTYQPVATTGEEVWIRAQAITYPGVSWTRSGTVLTLNGTASIGDLVCVYGAASDLAFGAVTASASGSFSITVPNTGGVSGTSASFAIVPGFSHDAAGPTKKGGTLLPGKLGTQVLSMAIHTGDRDATYDGSTYISSGYYYLTVPTDGGAGLRTSDNVGNNTDVWNSLIPMLPANGVFSRSMTRIIGAFANYDTSSGSTNYSKIRFEGLGASPVLIRFAF